MSVTLYDIGGLAATTTGQSMTVGRGMLSVAPLPVAIDDLNNGAMVEVGTFSDSYPAAVSASTARR